MYIYIYTYKPPNYEMFSYSNNYIFIGVVYIYIYVYISNIHLSLPPDFFQWSLGLGGEAEPLKSELSSELGSEEPPGEQKILWFRSFGG